MVKTGDYAVRVYKIIMSAFKLRTLENYLLTKCLVLV